MIKSLSPELKNAVIIEDDSSWQRRFESVLKEHGWIVVSQAMNMDEALKLIKKLGELNVSLVLLDGLLSGGGYNMAETYKNEGGEIAKQIRRLYPNITILGVSGAKHLQEDDPNITNHIGKQQKTFVPGIKALS